MKNTEPRGATPSRKFRIPESEYAPAMEKAKAESVTLTSVVRAAIREWVKR